MDWIGGIAAQNKFVSGTGLLFDGAKVVGHNKVVTDGPFGEDAGDYRGIYHRKKLNRRKKPSLAEFAKGCPVLQGEGNTMEVRRIAKH